MDSKETDEALMQRYQGGNTQAFEILYTRHKGGLYRYFLRQCRLAAVAEELYQDVWLNLIRARERYEPRAKFSTYLYRLAHNRLVDYYRRQASGVPISYDDPEDAPLIECVAESAEREPDNEFEARRQAQKLQQLIAELPDAQREAFLLREEGGLSLDEIAQATGADPETAKSRLRYAVAKLRSGLFDAAAGRALRRETKR